MLASQGNILWNCFSWSLNFKSKKLFIVAAVSYQLLWLNWFLLYSILTVISSVDCTWISKFRPKIIMLINFDKILGNVFVEPMQNSGLYLRVATLYWRPKFALGLFQYVPIWRIFHVIDIQLCEISILSTIWPSPNWRMIDDERWVICPCLYVSYWWVNLPVWKYWKYYYWLTCGYCMCINASVHNCFDL